MYVVVIMNHLLCVHVCCSNNEPTVITKVEKQLEFIIVYVIEQKGIYVCIKLTNK